MSYLALRDVLNLPNLNNKEGVALEEVQLSDSINVDPLDSLHERCGHCSKSKLLEGFKHLLFTGGGLTRALSLSPRRCAVTYANLVQKG